MSTLSCGDSVEMLSPSTCVLNVFLQSGVPYSQKLKCGRVKGFVIGYPLLSCKHPLQCITWNIQYCVTVNPLHCPTYGDDYWRTSLISSWNLILFLIISMHALLLRHKKKLWLHTYRTVGSVSLNSGDNKYTKSSAVTKYTIIKWNIRHGTARLRYE